MTISETGARTKQLPPRRVMAATRVLAIEEEPPVGKKAPPYGVGVGVGVTARVRVRVTQAERSIQLLSLKLVVVRVKVRVRVSLDLVVGRDECVQEHRRAARVHAVCSRRGSHV